MSSLATTLLLMSAALAADARVTTQDGTELTGTLEAVSPEEIRIDAGDGVQTLPLDQVRQIGFGEASATARPPADAVELRLADGSLLHAATLTATVQETSIASPALGDAKLATNLVQSVRFAAVDERVSAAWEEMSARKTQNDLLVIRKGDALDFAAGLVGEISAESVTLLLNQREIAVPRERVFGVVYAERKAPTGDVLCQIRTDAADVLQVARLSVTEEGLEARLIAGVTLTIDPGHARVADFGLGRSRYLADFEVNVRYEPVGLIALPFSNDAPITQKMRANRTLDDSRLVLARSVYDRFLWFHSGTTARYRLNRDYKRLQGTVGIDDSPPGCREFDTRVNLVIVGDGRTLLETEVRRGADPQDLDIDVEGIRDLEIRVQSPGETLGHCEHLGFAEARVLK
ncbi:NPCBM/NEW2 domain protein [Maioricimonas rarisocia]|uniref:NPCBM/NEW2 domain protein n=1 Tax=Maioricimonas rarisocia TaxID=2528026 RepID=A0A517Z1A2_9PLAN|nr:NPCBM/NEW2 domain-containing protein [Maioricimonas rarisocia]QDU36199.1 NPCBM/NEW2 domain protein [Maioricimonas rarisocia]